MKSTNKEHKEANQTDKPSYTEHDFDYEAIGRKLVKAVYELEDDPGGYSLWAHGEVSIKSAEVRLLLEGLKMMTQYAGRAKNMEEDVDTVICAFDSFMESTERLIDLGDAVETYINYHMDK